MSFDPAAIDTFRYLGVDVDGRSGTVTSHYALDDAVRFVEVVSADPGPSWDTHAVHEAARLVALLAGVSYYKAAAPRTIDLGDLPIRPGERAFLRRFYLDGLGEYAYRNGLDLSDLEVVGGRECAEPPVPWATTGGGSLIPFGGGIDSIVTVESVRPNDPDAALFVLGRDGARFDAIEAPAATTGLPIRRAGQRLDPMIRRSSELGFRNGHVPVTGVLSSIAVLVAALHGHQRVVMSNEWSASVGNTVVDGREVNHQWSKSFAFEQAFRDVLQGAFAPAPDYFSYLRARSELWVAERFASLGQYHHSFRSCNRSFRIDPAARLDRWCGTCDKCVFIDLILAPYLAREELRSIFDGREPLDDPSLAPAFRSLLAISADPKPFECVGDVDECRVAAVLAAERADRADQPLLHGLVAELGDVADAARGSASRLLTPLGPDLVPAALAS